MREVHINDSGILDEILKVFTSDVPVAVLEFPKVFGLFAHHSLRGADAMNAVKQRLPYKYYSSFLGDEGLFRKMIPAALQPFFDFVVEEVHGVSLRLPLTSSIKFPDVATHRQTHQILLEKPSLRAVIRQLDKALQTIFPKSDFYNVNYQSPLVSSLNLSGAPSGSIIDKEEALSFAKKLGIPLFIHTNQLEGPLGSYPIYSINQNGEVFCERGGLHHKEVEFQIKDYFMNNPLVES